jgi:predicted CXXCH cytochrome family protein
MKSVLGLAALALAATVIIGTGSNSSTAASAAALNPNHECAFCHGLHGGVSDPLLLQASIEATCLSCHGPGGTATLADVHRNDPTGNSCCAPFRVTCMECHDPHSNPLNWRGNENLKLVLSEITGAYGTRPVVLETLSADYSFCDIEGPTGVTGYPQAVGEYDNVCDVCHANPDMGRHHLDSDKQHHQSGSTCTRSGCHTHDNAFSP